MRSNIEQIACWQKEKGLVELSKGHPEKRSHPAVILNLIQDLQGLPVRCVMGLSS